MTRGLLVMEGFAEDILVKRVRQDNGNRVERACTRFPGVEADYGICTHHISCPLHSSYSSITPNTHNTNKQSLNKSKTNPAPTVVLITIHMFSQHVTHKGIQA